MESSSLINCYKCRAPVPQERDICQFCGAPRLSMSLHEPAFVDPFLERRLLDQYIIKKRLGEGAYGVVYEAIQPALGGKAAIKVLKPGYAVDPNTVKRFYREGQTLRSLDHPGAVKVYNLARTEDGFLWIAMELLEGETLGAYLRRECALSPEELLGVLLPLCGVLAFAHEKGIIHRDLKPDNIMLLGNGEKPEKTEGKEGTTSDPISRVKVLDFGLAGILDDPSAGKTQSNALVGTPAYMPPEQWKGTRHTDKRSDIYSLGVVVYQCLTGRLPFDAEDITGWLQKHCFEAPRGLGGSVSPALSQVVLKSLQKKPEERFQTVEEFQRAFEEASKEKGSGKAFVLPEAPAKARCPRCAAPISEVARFCESCGASLVAKPNPTPPPPPPRVNPSSPPPAPSSPEVQQLLKGDLKEGRASAPEDSSDSLDSLKRALETNIPKTKESPEPEPPVLKPSAPLLVPPALPLAAGLPRPRRRAPSALLALLGLSLLVGLAILLWPKDPPTTTLVASEDNTGTVTITTTPPQATIYLDDQKRPEETPATLSGLGLGVPHTLRIVKPGFYPFYQMVTIDPSLKTISVQVELKPAERGKLRVQSSLPGAKISLDNADTGKKTPDVLDNITAEEEHTLRLSFKGYPDRELRFTLNPGEERLITIDLTKAPPILSKTNPPPTTNNTRPEPPRYQTELDELLQPDPRALSPAQISATLTGAFRNCKSLGSAKVMLSLTVNSAGEVTKASADIKGGLGDCIVSVAKRLQFPTITGKSHSFTYPVTTE